MRPGKIRGAGTGDSSGEILREGRIALQPDYPLVRCLLTKNEAV
jgi:hypothetical protein